METRKSIPDSQEQNNYKLLSVNAVSKKLGVGYSTAKQWIQNGIIESVNLTGRLRVPEFKLVKFITQNNSLINCESKIKNFYEEDENNALSIIRNIKESNYGISVSE
ncbi:MAG: helix-turn-helix domain-containing protein [Ignavibacteria bacterium]|nr:helix-turn-helix domain-containing protein [Ignavibacteria bacterium]